MATVIRLDASMTSLLDWEKEEALAKDAEQIEWYFDWDIQEPLEDERQFHSFQLAIDHFKERLYPIFAEKSVAASIFQGRVPPFEREREEWLKDRLLEDSPFHRLLHQRDIFLDFLKLLATAFPVELPLSLTIDLRGLNTEELLVYLSYEPLWDFSLKVITDRRWQIDQRSKQALLLSREGYGRKEMAAFLEQSNQSFRLTFEDNFNMYWDLVEQLYLIPEFLSPLGRRMVQGFEATGGEAIMIAISTTSP